MIHPAPHSPRLATFRSILKAAALVAVLGPMTLDCGLPDDEFLCEEASAHLAECCPGFSVTTLTCTHAEGCNPHQPDLSSGESRSIIETSCQGLISSGMCGRAPGFAGRGASRSDASYRMGP